MALPPLALAGASLPASVITRRIGSRKAVIVGYLFITFGLFALPLSPYLPAPIRETWRVGSYALAWFCGSLLVVNTNPYVMVATKEQLAIKKGFAGLPANPSTILD